ncbi:MAG TPA: hypothetical protein VFB58_08720 [Chloroflexota bacterium]|nr:hypothetical protein [Chloroflexota bacterium]
MSSENNEDGFSITLPLGAAVGAIVIAAASTAAYLMLNGSEASAPSGSGIASSGRSALRRLGLMGLITVIENDASRRVLVAVLRAMARRA